MLWCIWYMLKGLLHVILQHSKTYILRIKPVLLLSFVVTYKLEELFLYATTDTAAHSILFWSFSLCGDFIHILKQSTLNIPNKPREKKGKGFCLCAHFLHLTVKAFLMFNHLILIWWSGSRFWIKIAFVFHLAALHKKIKYPSQRYWDT